VGPGVVGVRGVVEALFLSSVHGRGDPLEPCQRCIFEPIHLFLSCFDS